MSVSGKIQDTQKPWECLKSVYCESGAGTTPKVVFLFSTLEAAQKMHKWAVDTCLPHSTVDGELKP